MRKAVLYSARDVWALGLSVIMTMLRKCPTWCDVDHEGPARSLFFGVGRSMIEVDFQRRIDAETACDRVAGIVDSFQKGYTDAHVWDEELKEFQSREDDSDSDSEDDGSEEEREGEHVEADMADPDPDEAGVHGGYDQEAEVEEGGHGPGQEYDDVVEVQDGFIGPISDEDDAVEWLN
jgi:hypothetical protein